MAEVLAGDKHVCGLDSTCLGSLLLSPEWTLAQPLVSCPQKQL